MSKTASSDAFLLFLESIAGTEVHFFPKSGNAGDGFIAHATYELFAQHGVQATVRRQEERVQSGTVLIGGGGNLIEGRYDDVAKLIAAHINQCDVVVLPQTIMGNADLLRSTHGRLRVFCRDQTSYKLALANGANPEHTFLSQDVTFLYNRADLAEFSVPGDGAITILRQDGESARSLPFASSAADISLSWNGDVWTNRALAKHVTMSLAAYVSQFRSVTTDRLHISILSTLLGKETYLLPNAYFKNRAVFERSMGTFDNAHFVNTLPQNDDLPPIESGVSLEAELELSNQIMKKATTAASQIAELRQAVERERTMRETAERRLQLERDKSAEAIASLESSTRVARKAPKAKPSLARRAIRKATRLLKLRPN